jgi:hypothetical protein
VCRTHHCHVLDCTVIGIKGCGLELTLWVCTIIGGDCYDESR